MGIFAVADLHLPIKIQIKKFKYPVDYYERVMNYLKVGNPELLIIAGDFSYENDYRRGLNIIYQLYQLPGTKKVFVEGNHDGFCHTEEKKRVLNATFNNDDLYYLSNRAKIFTIKDENEDLIDIGVCGAMGWMLNEDSLTVNDQIMFQRAIDGLRNSLDHLERLIDEDGENKANICVMHHPPTYQIYTDGRRGDESLFNLIAEYKFIDAIVFGHIHVEKNFKLQTNIKGIDLYCSAVDQLGFKGVKIKI